MTRIRTKRTSRYLTISNTTAQDCNISFAALGLLTYCLSMPEEWDFRPQVIAKERNCGRDKCYSLFNELIMSYHCIRIKKPNKKHKNLPGEVEYEIFDDIEDCKARIIELEKTETFLEHGENFKKCYRHPAFQDAEIKDPEKAYLLKETGEKRNNVFVCNARARAGASAPEIQKEFEEVRIVSKEVLPIGSENGSDRENVPLPLEAADSPGQEPPIIPDNPPPPKLLHIIKRTFDKTDLDIRKSDLYTLAVQKAADWTASEIETMWDILVEYQDPIRNLFAFCEGTIQNLRKREAVKKINEQKSSWNNKKSKKSKNKYPNHMTCESRQEDSQTCSQPSKNIKENTSEKGTAVYPLADWNSIPGMLRQFWSS